MRSFRHEVILIVLTSTFYNTKNKHFKNKKNTFTIQPSGVVLVGSHDSVLPQCSKDSRVGAHKVNVHPCIQFSIYELEKKKRERDYNPRACQKDRFTSF